MFITKANFEKAIRRAKAEGKKEVEREYATRYNFETLERNVYDSMQRLEERIIRRFEEPENVK